MGIHMVEYNSNYGARLHRLTGSQKPSCKTKLQCGSICVKRKKGPLKQNYVFTCIHTDRKKNDIHQTDSIKYVW